MKISSRNANLNTQIQHLTKYLNDIQEALDFKKSQPSDLDECIDELGRNLTDILIIFHSMDVTNANLLRTLHHERNNAALNEAKLRIALDNLLELINIDNNKEFIGIIQDYWTNMPKNEQPVMTAQSTSGPVMTFTEDALLNYTKAVIEHYNCMKIRDELI